MADLYVYVRNWLKAQDGQDLIEYALLAGFISVVAVVAIVATGTSVSGLFDAVSAAVAGAAGGE
jgi:pilus assembly protein Flp/PilA